MKVVHVYLGIEYVTGTLTAQEVTMKKDAVSLCPVGTATFKYILHSKIALEKYSV